MGLYKKSGGSGNEELDNEECSFFFDPSLWKQSNEHDPSQKHKEKLLEYSDKKVKPTRIVKVFDGVYKVKP